MHSPETVRSTPCYQLAPTAIPCEAADWFDPLSSHYNKLFRSLLLLAAVMALLLAPDVSYH